MGECGLKGVPHKGWICVEVIDLADECDDCDEIEYGQCEMCGNEKIRFVHAMRHPDYPDILKVGCVCAEKMSDDYVSPRKREAAIRNKALRRKNFMRARWRYNPVKKTYSKKYKGEYITIVAGRYGGYGIYFAERNRWKDYTGNKINDFKTAENVAFEFYEEYHTTKYERNVWAT